MNSSSCAPTIEGTTTTCMPAATAPCRAAAAGQCDSDGSQDAYPLYPKDPQKSPTASPTEPSSHCTPSYLRLPVRRSQASWQLQAKLKLQGQTESWVCHAAQFSAALGPDIIRDESWWQGWIMQCTSHQAPLNGSGNVLNVTREGLPACQLTTTPLGASSKHRHCVGSTPNCCAAAANTSGAGLP